jgi:hypothetical protein
VSVPGEWTGGPFTIQVFDAARCPGSVPDLGALHDPFTTRFRVRGADLSPNEPLDNPVVATVSFPGTRGCGDTAILPRGYACGADGTWQMRWCNLATIADPTPGGVYFVQVDTFPAVAGARHAVNGFALRVRSGGATATGPFVPCSTDPTDPAVPFRPATCVGVSAVEWLSTYAAGTLPRPSFFLAEVGAEHAGASMEVSLYDLGEGAEAVEILDPSGRASGFDWRVDAEPGDATPTGGWAGEVPSGGALDVIGIPGAGGCGEGNPQRRSGRFSSSKYNDRLVRLTVPIPADAAVRYGDRRWWRVRYTTCAGRGVSDRTTWGVRIESQPVRLIR